MIHKYLHFARHSLTTPLHHHSTASLSAFFAALHPTSELFSNAFGLFRRQTSPVGTLRRHFCPFLPPNISRRNPQATLLPFFAARNLTSEPFSDTLDHFCHLASMQPIFPDSAAAHLSHLKQYSPDNDQVTVQGVNIITHLKVKEPSTVPPIGAPPFQVRNTTRTWNCIYPIIIKLQF